MKSRWRVPPVRRALVTGGLSGIGLAVAKQLAARGIEVWVAARRRDRLDAAIETITNSGGRAHAFELDISNVDEAVARLERLDADTGGIDLVVANAGLAGARGGIPLPDCEWADVRDVLHTNLTGAAATLFPFIRPMIARGYGHLVAIVRRARLVRFPWIMGLVARLIAWLPRFITRPLIRRSSVAASKKLPPIANAPREQ